MTRSTLQRSLGMLIEPDDTKLEARVRAELGEHYDDYMLITDYVAGALSPEDRVRLEERLRTDSKFHDLAAPLIRAWRFPRPRDRREDPLDAERAWQKLRARIELEEHGIHTRTFEDRPALLRRHWPTIVALCGALITAVVEFWQHPAPRWNPVPQMLVNADSNGTRDRALTLPDSTRLTLAPGSHVTYPRWFSRNERTLFVDGEATFTLAPGSGEALVVKGTNFEVTASAGSFTVHAFSHDPFAYVQVNGGTAEVRGRTVYFEGDVTTLRAGEGVRVGPGIRVDPVMPITLRH
jgi:ferric-dicitrate binding protein FerR (iron transport regulator)